MLKKNQQGLAPLMIVIIIVVVALVGAVGWLVWDRAQNNKVVTTNSSNQTNNAANKVAPTPTIPTGYVQFTDTKYGISFVYPEEWGTASLSIENGYLKYTYSANALPDGPTAYSITFSDYPNTGVQMYSTIYVSAPHGGSTIYGVVGFCQDSSGYSFKRRLSSNSDPLQLAGSQCDQDKLKNATLAGSALLATNVDMCNESGCEGQKNVLVVPINSSDIKAVIVTGEGEINSAFANNFAKSLTIK